MKPLNFAILKYFTKVDYACADDILEALKDQYGHFKAFNKKDFITTLMTAETNGLITERSYDLDKSGNVRIYYHANEESRATINKYINS